MTLNPTAAAKWQDVFVQKQWKKTVLAASAAFCTMAAVIGLVLGLAWEDQPGLHPQESKNLVELDIDLDTRSLNGDGVKDIFDRADAGESLFPAVVHWHASVAAGRVLSATTHGDNATNNSGGVAMNIRVMNSSQTDHGEPLDELDMINLVELEDPLDLYLGENMTHLACGVNNNSCTFKTADEGRRLCWGRVRRTYRVVLNWWNNAPVRPTWRYGGPAIEYRRSFRSSCFHVATSVRLAGGATKALMNLTWGNRVDTFSGMAVVTHTAFLMDFHALNTVTADFIKVNHERGTLHVTPEHLVFVHLSSAAMSTKRAIDLRVGDLLHVRGPKFTIRRSAVTAIGTVQLAGISAPLTFRGTLFVEDVAVSSYGVQHSPDVYKKFTQHCVLKHVVTHAHAISHAMLLPLRVVYYMGGHFLFCLVAPSLCDESVVYTSGNKMHRYVSFAKMVFDTFVWEPNP